jgi:hypothetical protein
MRPVHGISGARSLNTQAETVGKLFEEDPKNTDSALRSRRASDVSYFTKSGHRAPK